ncbi:hypothetical protein [Nonomuraea sp. CA-141351]|uniref:hypothetical protein n=1 Tax=Nonomuraea sp. CA-141351 TaxID=3239996 RepID=UPI003D8B8CC3
MDLLGQPGLQGILQDAPLRVGEQLLLVVPAGRDLRGERVDRQLASPGGVQQHLVVGAAAVEGTQ